MIDEPWLDRVEIGDAVLLHGDCLEILPTLDKVDVVFTSPPYSKQRDYEGTDGFDWSDAPQLLDRMYVSDDTQIFMNCGLVHKDGAVSFYWDKLFAHEAPFGWYVWDQGFALPGNWNGRLGPRHEFIFHFTRKPRQPHKTKPSKTVGRKLSNTGLTRKDGTSQKLSHAGQQVNTHKIPDSVIDVTREMRRDYDHPARFPVGLPTEFIHSYSDPEQTICDPFMGSGTTGVACANLGRKFIGIELERKYFDIACERIEAAYSQWRLFA